MNHKSFWTTFGLAVIVASTLACGQEPQPAEPPDPPGRRVFVPIEELQTLIHKDQKWVMLPREEFNRLYAEAKKNSQDKTNPPQEIAVGRVEYAGRIIDDQLVITATLDVNKFSGGWQSLPLDFRDLALEKAVVGDQPAQLGRDAQGQLILLLDKPGKQKVTLELSRPLVAVGSDKFATFGLAPRWPAELVLDVPPEKHLQWNGVAVDRPAVNDQPAQYRLAFGGQKQSELRITDRPTTQSSEGLVFAQTTLGLRAAPEEVTWQAVTSLQVFGKPIDQLQLRVPEALQIISITSPGLESWEFGPKGPENGETILNLQYRQSFQEPREVTVQAVLATKTGESWQVPNLKLANVASHVTQVLVTTAPGIRLQVDEAVGVQRVAADGPPNPAGTDIRFSAWREDFLLRIMTQPKAREISAAVVTLLDINNNGLDLQSRATVETKFAPLFDVSITLPAEWTVTDVLVNQQRVPWETVPQEAGLHLLRVAFETPLPVNQRAVIQLTAHRDPPDWPLEEKPALVSLPEVRVLQTNVVEGTVAVSADRDLEVQPQEVKGLAPTMLDPALAARLSYEYQDTHYSGQIQVTRKPSRLAVRTLAFHRLDKETFLSHLEARVTIEGGGARKLQVSTPEAVGTNLRFELVSPEARIVEQTPADPANGRRIWILSLDQRAHGDALVYVDVSQPRQQAKEFIPPTIQVIGAEREIGMIAFEAEPDQQLDISAVNAAGAALPDVDPTDLMAPTGYFPKERIVAAFSYVLPGYQLKLTERRFTRVPVPTAICDRLQIRSILGETGELQNEAIFQFRAVGVQSLQVVLPPEAVLWATLLDDAPIEVRKTGTAYLIPLASAIGQAVDLNQDPSRARTLKLYYRTTVPPLQANGKIIQQPPGITVLNGDGTEQPLEILQQTWTIDHPELTELVADPGSFVAEYPYQRVSVLGSLLHSFKVDTPINLFWKLVTLLVSIGVIWILRYAYRHATGNGIVSAVVLLFVAGVVLFALTLPAVQSARESASRPESANNLKQGGWARDEYSAKMSNRPTVGAPAPAASLSKEAAQTAADAAPDRVTAEPTMDDLKEDVAKTEAPAAGEKNHSEAAPAESKPKDEKSLAGDKQQAVTEEIDRANPPSVETKKADAPPPPVPAPEAPQVAQVAQPANRQPQPGEQRQAQQQQPAGNDFVAPMAERYSRAVLSLALNLETPPHSQSTSYTFRGRLHQTPPVLEVTYQNRAKLSFIMLLVQVGMILICWLVRERALAVRGMILALGIGLPLGLITVVPESVLPFLDGVLLGTLFGVLLWMVIALCSWANLAKIWTVLKTPIETAAVMFLAICLASTSTMVLAQDGSPPVLPPAKPIIDAESIIVPFDSVTDPLKSNRVFLPHEKFLELWKQAHPDDLTVNPSPVAATVAEALYGAELVPAAAGRKASIKLTGRFVCYTYQPGQVTLPLPLGKVAVADAKLDGESAPLVTGSEQTPLAVVISKPGVHVVDLTFQVPVQLTGPAGIFSLDLAAVPAGTLRFKVPAADLNFRVNGASGAFRRTGQGADAALIVPVAAGGKFQVSWQPKQNRGDVEAIVHVESTTAVMLTEEGTRLLSHWVYQVRQGSISEAVFSLPPALSVRKIEGQDVGGWELGGEGDSRQLKIFLRRKVEDSTQLKFDLYLKQHADDVETTYAIPQFAPQNITRETGTVAVLADKQFALRVGNISGLSQIEPGQVPLQRFETEFKAPVVLAYRFAARPYTLDLVVTRRQPQLKVAAHHLAHIDTRKVQQQNRFQFRLTGAPRAGVVVMLPQGYLLQTVTAPEVTDWHVSGREDSADMDAEAMLHLEFATPRVGNFDVVLVGKTLRQANQPTVEVNLPYPIEADEIETQLLTTFDPVYAGTVGTLDNWKSIDPAGLVREFLGETPVSNQLAYSTTAPAPAPVPFDLTQARAQLFSEKLALVTVGEESIEYLFALQWKIIRAGADTFVFTTPDWLAGKLEFPEGSGPRRRGITHENIEDGRTRWTITLEDPQRNSYFIVGRAVLPASAKGEITAPNFIAEELTTDQDPPTYTPLQQSQFVVLVNQSQTQLTSNAGELAQAIPADDLQQIIKLRQDLIDQAAEILRVLNPQTQIIWRQQRFQAERQLPAAVNLADHVTVLALDGSWREQVTYRVKNRQRQFLAIKLPPESQILSLFVKGQPSRPVLPGKELPYTLIPLPKTVEGDVSFDVQLVLAGQLSTGGLPRRWALLRTTLDVPIPEVVPPEESREYGIPVSQTTWTVYLPRDLDVDILKRTGRTNVTLVSEYEQSLDQMQSEFADVADLTAVNLGNKSRRARAQALNNLKQLNEKSLKQINDKLLQMPEATFAASKREDLQRRVAQAQQSIDKLIVSNGVAGLILQNDSAGNTIVIDQKAAKSEQTERLHELYVDNDPSGVTITGGTAMTYTEIPQDSSGKGNLNRANLRGFNSVQVLDLAAEQSKKSSQKGLGLEADFGGQQAASKTRSYFFQQQQVAPPRDLTRRGDSVAILGGVERQLQFSNDLQVPYVAPGGVARQFQGVDPSQAQSMGAGMSYLYSHTLKSAGGGAGMMGGMGGMPGVPVAGPGPGNVQLGFGMPGQPPLGEVTASPVWSTSGGLSLLINIPKDGQALNFSKVSGGARLGLGIRPHETLQRALGLIWTAIWVIFVILIASALMRRSAAAALTRDLPWFLLAIGIALFFLVGTNSPLAYWGLGAFVCGAFWIAFRPLAKA